MSLIKLLDCLEKMQTISVANLEWNSMAKPIKTIMPHQFVCDVLKK